MSNSFGSESILRVGDREFTIFSLSRLAKAVPEAARLPYSLKILLENLLRAEDGETVQAADIEALARWSPNAEPTREIAFRPSRVLLQDFTGVPAVVDLAAMRDAMKRLGGDPSQINPLQPAELVIDHSVQTDAFGSPDAVILNTEKEFERNAERYGFLRWGQRAFRNFRVVPPSTGIVHQVNLEHLARVVFARETDGGVLAYPDTLVGTDSHTTMINGLGVLGWGVGGIEAEAAMLGQPISMLIPQVVGFRLYGELPEGVTATDLVLTVTEMLRQKGVVGKFVEFFGEGLSALPLADRATLSNMAPEYGATCGFCPVDEETLNYLRLTGRPQDQIDLIEAYCKEQGLFFVPGAASPQYSDSLELDLGSVEPSLAGPKRPQDRLRLSDVPSAFQESLDGLRGGGKETATPKTGAELRDGSVVLASITSCTNTSNPSVMIGAGLVAKKAVEKGLRTKPWVKTSLAPGSKVVTDYLIESGLMPALEELRFHVVGYGCMACIGNSGPLPEEVSTAIRDGNLVVCSVLSGNRNFEGRVHAEVRANFLASPPLVVAYALAGRIDIDLRNEPLGEDRDGRPVYLRDLWPTHQEIQETVAWAVTSAMFTEQYGDVFKGDERWNAISVPEGDLFAWDDTSTYVKHPPFFEDMALAPPGAEDIKGARVLALLGESVTTDHISPAGSIPADSPAGRYLVEHGVQPKDFNSYGSRRGNHEVMMRGTFANVRLRNRLAPGTEGGITRHLPTGEQMTIFDASERYRAEGVPIVVIAGKEYGSGSSRDWAAKGPHLLGVRVVVAETYERIHRSNLIGMGVLPLEFAEGRTAGTLGLTGEEVYDFEGIEEKVGNSFKDGRTLRVKATRPDGSDLTFQATIRLDTPEEVRYYENGGILQYVLRQLLA